MTHFSRNIKLGQLWLLAVAILLSGCQIADVTASSNPPEPLKKEVIKPLPLVKTVVQTSPPEKIDAEDLKIDSTIPVEEKLFQKILTGEFEAVGSELSSIEVESDSNLQKIKDIVSEYEHIQQLRKVSRVTAYDEQHAEFEELIAKDAPADVNDISEAFVIIVKLYKRGDKEQKKELLENEYVKNLVQVITVNGQKYLDENKWVDAYSHCYYWLGALDKDNKEYKDLNENLMDKIIIEGSLTNNYCDTGMERHEGIKSDMLVRAMKILELNYISVIDYSEMAQKAIERCSLLGEVLLNTSEDLDFKVTAKNAELWDAGMQMVADDIKQDQLSVVTKDKFLWLFRQILAINEVTLAIPQEVVIAQFCEAAFVALDPVTNLIWPWQVKSFQKSMTQNFTGIGVQISKVRGVLTVSSLLPDKPAYYSGLDADDEILEVNGESTKDMPITCAVSKITGPAGTDVTLTVHHKGAPEGETEDITITRALIDVATVRGWQRTAEGKWLHMVDPVNKLGYIRITNFTGSTEPATEQALKQLERDGMKGLILDLRYNSGGYLNTAADIVDKFIEKGLIVKSQPRWALPTYEMAHKPGTHPNYPIVILINGGSASASEIVAGALTDEKYKRATIVGSRSYGKGSVQTITGQTGLNSQMKYTMAFYYLPSGQPVKTRYILKKEDRTDWGIEPNVTIKLRDDEAVKMIETQQANDVLAKANHNDNAEPVKRYTLGETLELDPQLATGLLVLKTKVIKEGGAIEQIANARPEKKGLVEISDSAKNEIVDSKE
jgi:C-terminal peptidase prc